MTDSDLEGLREQYKETKDIGGYVRYHALVPELFAMFPEMMDARARMHLARIEFESILMRATIELDQEDLDLF